VPTKVNLQKPLQQSNWLAALFWISMFIMLLISLSCLCRMCPNCFPAIWSSLAWCASGYLSGMRSCIDTCIQTARNPPSNVSTEDSPLSETLLFPPLAPFSDTVPAQGTTSMRHPRSASEGHHGTVMDPNMLERIPLFHTQVKYPNLESNYEIAKPVHTWRLSKGGYNEYLLTSLVPDGLGGMATIFFDLVDGHAIDQYNSPLHYISPPDQSLIQLYRDKVKTSLPPAFMISNGCITLPGAHHIIFSPETNHWINKATKRIVSGLNIPSPPQNPPKG